MKIVFFGTPNFAVPALEILSQQEDIEIQAVVTQPDRPTGRKQELTAPPVKVSARKHKLPVIQAETQQNLKQELQKIEADLYVVIAYGMILNDQILSIPKHGAINLHGSLLPNYRGASPIQEALLNGDQETGISLIKMNSKMDQGDILLLQRLPIEASDTSSTLADKLSVLGATILPFALRDYVSQHLKPIPQNNQKASYCRKITKQDGQIKAKDQSAIEIINRLRAYTPWPGIHTHFHGKKLQILEAEATEIKVPAGEFQINQKTLLLGTKSGSLALKKVQLEGKSPVDADAFINGNQQLLNSK